MKSRFKNKWMAILYYADVADDWVSCVDLSIIVKKNCFDDTVSVADLVGCAELGLLEWKSEDQHSQDYSLLRITTKGKREHRSFYKFEDMWFWFAMDTVFKACK